MSAYFDPNKKFYIVISYDGYYGENMVRLNDVDRIITNKDDALEAAKFDAEHCDSAEKMFVIECTPVCAVSSEKIVRVNVEPIENI